MVILKESNENANTHLQPIELDENGLVNADLNALKSLAKNEVMQSFSLADISHPLMQAMIAICIERRVAMLLKQVRGQK